MHAVRLFSLVLLAAMPALAAEEAIFLEVRNAGPPLFQHVVEHRAALAKLFPRGAPKGVSAVETDRGGRSPRPAVAQLDIEGEEAVLALLLDGVTSPGQRRYFLVTPEEPQATGTTDLRVDTQEGELLISNQYFTARVAQKGRGGFPDTIVFNGSGNRYESFYYGDRLYTKERGTRLLADDPSSAARIVSRGPLRITVETTARYGSRGRYASGNARAVYRYVYRAYSPVVDVATTATRADDYRWSELQYLQLSRKDTLFSHWVGGEPVAKGKFLNEKKGRHLARWAVMHNADDAVGVGHPGGITLYDGTDYCNYVKAPVGPWTTRTYQNSGRLYFGPAQTDPQRYAGLLTGRVRVAIRTLPLPPPARPQAIPSKYRLESESLSLEFAGEAAGLGLVRLASKLAGRALVAATEPKPTLWRIELRSENQGLKPITLDNRAKADCSATVADGRLVLKWDGLDAGVEKNALSVTATIEVSPPGRSTWRIQVDCRSKRYGVWDIDFPLVGAVASDAVAVPRSNWGHLYRDGKHRQAGRYPSANWPMQFLCVDSGQGGLYLACHDPQAQPKQFSLQPRGGFHFRVHAPNQGVAGNGYRQTFPIVLAAYRGDWWAGSRLYRRWALAEAPWTTKGPLATRKDTPKKLLDLGLWMLGGGHPKDVVPKMKAAAALFRLPIGIHWYNWHQIPFDTDYPNYFPTKPGFAAAVRELTGAGMVIMPYINGRLWDTGGKEFPEALPYACKNTGGKNYVEVYGSKVPLAPMCPATKFWQDKVNDICRRLMTEVGVNAIYIDQVAAAAPQLCYDKSHGHPLGGGSHWVDGYRKMLTRINTMAHAGGRDVVITTENNAEPYMDNVDAFLTWNPRYDAEIPMLPAVYSGHTIYFSSPCNVGDTLKAFAMSQGRDFLWGCQLGWMGFDLLAEKNRKKAQYLNDLAAHRLAAAKFMIYGELLGEFKPLNDIPKVEVTWGRRRPHKAALPAVMATVWRSRDGRLAIVATNWDERPHLFGHRFDPAAWGGLGPKAGASPPLLFSRVGPGGTAHVGYAPGPLAERTERLRPREVLVLAVQPAPPAKALLDALATQIRSGWRGARVPKLTGAVADRCRALLGAPGDPKAPSEPLAMRQAKQCALDLLMADMGLSVAVAPREIVCPPNDWRWINVTLGNSGQKAIEGRCRLMGREAAYRVAPGKAATVKVAVQNPYATFDVAQPYFVHMGISFSRDGGGPELSLPVVIRSVEPVGVELKVHGQPRAGEDCLVSATVTNNLRAPTSPTLVLQAPASWTVTPGRRLRLPRMRSGERRVVTFLCALPRDARPGRTRIAASVVQGDAEQHIQVKPPRPQARATHRNGAPTIDGDLADWRKFTPVVLDGGKHVKVESWKGPDDCSARLWTGWDAESLFVAAEVRDDAFDQKQRGFAIWQGDCIQMALSAGPPRSESGYGGVVEFGLALTPDGAQVFQWLPEARELPGATLVVRRAKGRLAYEAALPWAALGTWRPADGASVGWSFTVNDADGEGFRGWLEWTPGICGGKDAAAFGRLVLAP